MERLFHKIQTINIPLIFYKSLNSRHKICLQVGFFLTRKGKKGPILSCHKSVLLCRCAQSRSQWYHFSNWPQLSADSVFQDFQPERLRSTRSNAWVTSESTFSLPEVNSFRVYIEWLFTLGARVFHLSFSKPVYRCAYIWFYLPSFYF